MPNSSFHTAISRPRYLRYIAACGNKRRALKLYRANIDLSLKIFAVIGVLEIILRNSIDRYMISQKGPTWLEDAVAPGGYLHLHPYCKKSYHSVKEAIQILGPEYSHDSLVSQLPFGFWRNQFAYKEYVASNYNLLKIFSDCPRGTNQKDAYVRLMKINEIRNRIAHHEPICFYGNLISTEIIEKRYHTILQLLHWLGCNPTRILYGIDKVPKSISFIKKL